MKSITRITLMAALLIAGGCQYDDSSLWGELDSQAKRIAALETWQKTVNGNIDALQTIVSALEAKDYVTSVEPFSTPLPGGYYIHFSKSPQATIQNGENGEKGDKGDIGEQGAAGATPQVGVKEYPENSGVYYWTLNNDFLLDDSENKSPVTGTSDTGATGADGATGATGATGITPKVRINSETNKWEVCTTGACTNDDEWESTNMDATGPQGEQGPQGDAIFAPNGVDNSNPSYVEFTLADGETKIKVSKYSEAPRFLSFGFKASDNPLTLIYDIAGVVEDSVIKVLIPHVMTSGKTFIPTFTIAGSGVSIGETPQQSGANSVNFSSPVVYTVSHLSGATKRYTVQVSSFTGLPMVFINTKNNAQIASKDNYVDATIRIVDGTSGSGGDFSGEMKIKGRGNSTWGSPKKPYKM
jgi:hypothetical protein